MQSGCGDYSAQVWHPLHPDAMIRLPVCAATSNTCEGLLLQKTFANGVPVAVPQPACLLISVALSNLSCCCLGVLIGCIALFPSLDEAKPVQCFKTSGQAGERAHCRAFLRGCFVVAFCAFCVSDCWAAGATASVGAASIWSDSSAGSSSTIKSAKSSSSPPAVMKHEIVKVRDCRLS